MIALLTMSLSAQPGTVVKQWTMQSFYPRTQAETKGLWIFNSTTFYSSIADSLHEDASGNDNDLTIGGWSGYGDVVDSLLNTSPLTPNSFALSFDGASTFFSILDAAASDLEPGTGDFSISVYIKPPTGSLASEKLISKRASNPGWDVYLGEGVASGRLGGVIHDGSTFVQNYTSSTNVISGSIWRLITWNFDRDGNLSSYKDGAIQNAPISIATVNGNVTGTSNFYIGCFNGSSLFYTGEIAYVKYQAALLTTKQMKEDVALDVNWNSYSGNVSRDSSYAWYQTFDTDTLTSAIGVASTLSAGQEWYVTLTAKAKTSADTLDIYFVDKSSTQRKRVGTSWTTFTLPMGDGYNLLATDSLAIGGGSDFDYDNVYISKSTHHLSTPVNQRGNLGGYGEY